MEFEEIMKMNALIGAYEEIRPTQEFAVAHETQNSIRFNPAHTGYYPSPWEQKKACEKHIEEYKLAKDGWIVKEYLWWPYYEQDWNALMRVVEKIEQSNRVDIVGKTCKISHPDWQNDIAFAEETKHLATYLAVYKYVLILHAKSRIETIADKP